MILSAIAALALAAGPDAIYVYGTPNRQFQCQVYLAYFNTEVESVLFADHCKETSRDFTNWPHFVPREIYISLDFAPRISAWPGQPRILRDCLFVAHAQSVNRTTSTVIDCR